MRVIVAEDDPIPRVVLEKNLAAWGYDFTAADDGGAALAMLQRPGPCLALLDWVMPGLDGPEVCRRVRLRGDEDDYKYLILLSGRTDTEDVVAGLDAGADDYLQKPFKPAELRARLRVGERVLEMHHKLVRAREQMRHQATHDPLTGVRNRGAILDALHAEAHRAARTGGDFAVVMIDLDHFKHVNDAWGHQVGDQVLRETAQRVLGAVRPYDTLGRYGGEEFLLVLSDCPPGEVARLAERLRAAASREPVRCPGAEVLVTLSLGVAVTRAPDPAHVDSLLRRADAALYRAKAAGRDRAVVVNC